MKSKFLRDILVALASGIAVVTIEYYFFMPKRQQAPPLQNLANESKPSEEPKPSGNTYPKEEPRKSSQQDTSKSPHVEIHETGFESVLNNQINTSSERQNLVICIKSTANQTGFLLETHIISIIEFSNFNIITNYFKETFKTSNYFDQMFDGDASIIKQSIMSSIDGIILGKLTYSFRKNRVADNDLTSCDVELSCVFFNSSGHLIYKRVLTSIGAGFDNPSALERGLEILAKEFSKSILACYK